MDAVLTVNHEWEDMNSARAYPFAADSDLPPDVFVDMTVVSGSGNPVLLSEADFSGGREGRVLFSCGDEEISGSFSVDGPAIPLLCNGLYRGSLMVGEGFGRELVSGRKFSFNDGVPVCPSCVVSCGFRGVSSLRFEDAGLATTGAVVELVGQDNVFWPELSRREDGDWDLRFHAVNTNTEYEPTGRSKSGRVYRLKTLALNVIGKSLIDVVEDYGNRPEEAFVYAPELERDDVCYRAHRDSSMSYIYDTCADESGCESIPISTKDAGTSVSGCSVWLRTDMEECFPTLWPKNSVVITPMHGGASATAPRLAGLAGAEAAKEMESLLHAPPETGNGIMISIPGMGGGNG